MEIKSNTCPNCGAFLNSNISLQLKCEYCGSIFNSDDSTIDEEKRLIDPEIEKYIKLHQKIANTNKAFLSSSGDFKHPGSILNQSDE